MAKVTLEFNSIGEFEKFRESIRTEAIAATFELESGFNGQQLTLSKYGRQKVTEITGKAVGMYDYLTLKEVTAKDE